jgi:hypothetical protein
MAHTCWSALLIPSVMDQILFQYPFFYMRIMQHLVDQQDILVLLADASFKY